MAILKTNNRNRFNLCLLMTLMISASGQAQLATPGNTAQENVRAIGARSPGRMVTAGVGRAIEAFNTFRAGPTISETSRPTPIHAQFLAEAIDIIFDQVNDLFFFLRNLALISAGENPLDPPTTPDTGGGRDPSRPGR